MAFGGSQGGGECGCASPDAVREQLDRLLASSALRYSERSCRFLRYVVEQQLAGNDGQLKEAVLAVEIFDREASYDSRVDSVVRVEARRLREKLDKYYSGEGREDPVVIELPKGSYAPAITVRSSMPFAPAVMPQAAVRGERKLTIKTAVLVGAICVAATALLTWWIAGSRSSPPPPLRRLTSDSGLTFQPALSADGKLVAYSSDRSGRGDLDIWLQQSPGGVPLRLTEGPGDEIEPSFSPDGTQIAYRENGNAGGIYLVPSLGGKSTLLAEGGYRPRFSADGQRVAYWTGERLYGTAKIFVVPAAGGNPAQLQAEFAYAAFPVWSPDGNYIAFVGSRSPLRNDWNPNADDWDWWVAPAAGGPAVPMGVKKIFERQRLEPPQTGWSHRRIIPYSWSPAGHIVFAAARGEQTNIWKVDVSPRTFQAAGPAEQLTFGAGRQDQPSMGGDGALVFAALTRKSDVWSLPIDANAAEPLGPAERLTSGPSNYMSPVVSRDGGMLAFNSDSSGNEEVRVRDLRSGKETALTAKRDRKTAVVLSPDGSKVAIGHASRFSIFVMPSAGGRAEQLCEDCGEPRGWLPDGSGLLYQSMPGGEWLVGRLDLSGRQAQVARSSSSALFSPSASPDGKFMALIVRTPPDHHSIQVARLEGGTAAPQAEWIAVTEPGEWVDKPRWSPDGNTLYYVSDRDGFVCLWARRLNAATRKPVGEPKAVVHFHSVRNSLSTVFGLELSVARDKLVFNLDEGSGSVWLAPAGK